ncbi:MAG: hypothetical protein ACFB5Z_04490 [Elainellaceae cyanobacterium]
MTLEDCLGAHRIDIGPSGIRITQGQGQVLFYPMWLRSIDVPSGQYRFSKLPLQGLTSPPLAPPPGFCAACLEDVGRMASSGDPKQRQKPLRQ